MSRMFLQIGLFFSVSVFFQTPHLLASNFQAKAKLIEDKLGIQVQIVGLGADAKGKAIHDYGAEDQVTGWANEIKKMKPAEIEYLKTELAGYKRIVIKPTENLPSHLVREIRLYDFPHGHAGVQTTVHALDLSPGQSPVTQLTVTANAPEEIQMTLQQKQYVKETFRIQPKAEKLPWLQMFYYHNDWTKDGLRDTKTVTQQLFIDHDKLYPEVEIKPELKKKMWVSVSSNRTTNPHKKNANMAQSFTSLKFLGFTMAKPKASTDMAWLNQIPGAGSNTECVK